MNNSIIEKIDYLLCYYLDIQDYIESFSFPRIDYLFLIKNISSIYKILNIAKEKINKCSNKIIVEDIYNLVEDYKNGKIIEYKKEDKDLFLSLICIPEKLIFTKDIYGNIVNINNIVIYVNKTINYVLEEDKKDEETDKDKFK